MIKNVLITGGAGYIGSHIAEIFLKEKKNVVILDNLSTGFRKLINKKSKFLFSDILDQKKIQKAVKDHNIDSVIHLAAVLSVGESQKNPKKYFKINVLGTRSVLLGIKNSQVKNFIFSSTCAVYKDGLKSVSEKSILKPTSNYGKTKLKGEKLIQSFCIKNKINYGILRFFNVAGASSSGKIGQINKGDQLFKNLSSEIHKKKPIFKIYGSDYSTNDGSCVRDYIHVNDIAKLHFKILKKLDKIKKSEIFNCGYSRGVSVKQVIEEFKKKVNKKIRIIYLPRRKGDMEKIIADTKKLNKFLKWRPQYNKLKEIVNSSIKWEKKLKK